MNLDAPVTTIMSTDLRTAGPEDSASILDELFKEFRIHHVPILEGKNVVGIISKSDFLYLLRGYTISEVDKFTEAAKLRAFKIEEIMSKPVVTIRDTDSIRTAVDILSENRFRCLPVLNDSDEIMGILTTHDIIDMVKENL